MLECYGESLIRKFGAEGAPQAWIGAIASLDDIKLARGMRRLLFGGKPHPPSLPEFLRLCRMVADDDIDETPSQRALAAPAGNFDKWDEAGNLHFLGYITRRLSETPRAWGDPNSREQETATRIALRYKNAWVVDMREGRGITPDGEMTEYPLEEQESSWNDLMEQAEASIALAHAKAAA